ncbi:hypothetical protein WUBG_00684 [Wuchereria bancrofti]|uniref:Uncharacterized protein n=1 Tax=Wuchereria bancrofti TaxID=6293 RepID=J9FFJ1_WUCBA|nr:hypothetical protein WUBG_00684 [Wuchereria bancrofti]
MAAVYCDKGHCSDLMKHFLLRYLEFKAALPTRFLLLEEGGNFIRHNKHLDSLINKSSSIDNNTSQEYSIKDPSNTGHLSEMLLEICYRRNKIPLLPHLSPLHMLTEHS